MAIAFEVELAPKSKPRLNAILQLHLGWIVARKTHAVIYICGDQEGPPCRSGFQEFHEFQYLVDQVG
jgi:hypothetical protein